MALSIEKDSIYTIVSIPLAGSGDEGWEDNTWIVEHLRQLADTIEEEQFKIHKMGIEMDAGYKKPLLVLKCFESRESEKMIQPEFKGERLKDYGHLLHELQKVKDFHNFGGAEKLCKEYNVTRQEYNWFKHQVRFGQRTDVLTTLMLSKEK